MAGPGASLNDDSAGGQPGGIAMIVVRRIVAVLLTPLLLLAFAFALLAGRADATVLDAGFVEEQLREFRLYERVHDELFPHVVEHFGEGQEENLPEHLRGIDLPTDEASVERITILAQTFLPTDYIQTEVEEAIDEVWPWLAGKEDDFEVNISLRENLLTTFGHHDSGGPSLFEQTWRDIDLGRSVLTSLAATAEEQRAAEGVASEGDADEPGVLDLVAADTDGAVAWLETSLFGAIDSLLPYLVGDSQHFAVKISFSRYPYLAEVFAGPLRQEPELLRRDGWGFTDKRIADELARSGRDFAADADRSLAIFRSQGARIGAEDVSTWIQEQREQDRARDPQSDAGLDPLVIHERMARFRLAAVFGSAALATLLVLLVGLLGGRQSYSRVAWGASALLFASAVSFALASPVYAAALGGRVSDTFAEAKAAPEGNVPLALRAALIDQAAAAVDDFRGGIAARARNWSIVSLLALAGAAGWRVYDGRRLQRVAVPAGADEPAT